MTSPASVGSDERIRLFLGLRLRDTDLDTLVAWQAGRLERMRVLPRDHLHVTLAFLGHRPTAELPAIVDALRAAAAEVDGEIRLTVKTGDTTQTVHGSHLLVATGRRPNTDDVGLQNAGVQTDGRGFIHVNNRLETNVPGIWALGDVKGGPAFTHISYNDHQILYANLIEGKSLTTDNRLVPYAVFTDPQLGRVGQTEKEARAAGRRLKIGKIPMAWVARAIERDETTGLMKLVVDADSDRILGAAILSSEGGELVQILHAVMLAGAPYTVLKGAIYIHPTLAEGFWTLMEEVKRVD